MDPIETALAFVKAINAKNIDDMYELMTADHTFVDADGAEHCGNDRMCSGWKDYFSFVPDFHIDVAETFVRDNIVMMNGKASGTFTRDGTLNPEYSWTVPAAWRVVVDDDRIVVWQLYVNPELMRPILERLDEATSGKDVES